MNTTRTMSHKEEDETPMTLHRYARSSDTQKLAVLIKRGLHINVKDEFGKTPLMIALNVDQEASIIELFIKENADIYTTDINGKSALSIVIEKSHTWLPKWRCCTNDKGVNILKLFFKKLRKDFRINREFIVQKLQDTKCPIALIPFMQDVTITEYFLEQHYYFIERVGALTILHVAVLLDDVEHVEFLIAHSANLVNDVGYYGRTPLHVLAVCTENSIERITILELLLNHEALLNIPNREGVTAAEHILKTGCQNARIAIYQNCRANDGSKPIHYLLQNISIRKTLEVEIKLLLNKGYDINMRDSKGISVIVYAIFNKSKIVEFLIKNGAEVSWTDIVKKTRMLKCLSNDNNSFTYWYDFSPRDRKYYEKLVTIIIQYQLDVNIKDLFRDVNKGFLKKFDEQFYVQIVIAQLVIEESIGEKLPTIVYKYIKSTIELREHYNHFKERIEFMKTIAVCGSVNLYQLLISSDEQIDEYISIPDFTSQLRNLLDRKYYQNFYYAAIIRKRIEKAIKCSRFTKQQIGNVICDLTGLNMYGITGDHYVVYKILNYLNLTKRDILNLCEGQLILPKDPMHHSNGFGNLMIRSMKKMFL